VAGARCKKRAAARSSQSRAASWICSRTNELGLQSRSTRVQNNLSLWATNHTVLKQREKTNHPGFFLGLNCGLDWIPIQIKPGLVWYNRTGP
jgi:hypothetical protein